MQATIERPAIGETVPGYTSRVVRPVVRVESWGPCGLGLEPIDPRDAAADGWSATPEYRVTTLQTGISLAVRVEFTGRTVRYWGGSGWIRAKLELCGDGEPSRFVPCWILAE